VSYAQRSRHEFLTCPPSLGCHFVDQVPKIAESEKVKPKKNSKYSSRLGTRTSKMVSTLSVLEFSYPIDKWYATKQNHPLCSSHPFFLQQFFLKRLIRRMYQVKPTLDRLISVVRLGKDKVWWKEFKIVNPLPRTDVKVHGSVKHSKCAHQEENLGAVFDDFYNF